MSHKDPEYHRQWTNKYNRARWKRHKKAIVALKQMPCVDCRQTYPPCVMEFHHRDSETKSGNVGDMLLRSMKIILAEVAKCDLLCANCHRLRHYEGDED